MRAIYLIFAIVGWAWTLGFFAYLFWYHRRHTPDKLTHDQQL